MVNANDKKTLPAFALTCRIFFKPTSGVQFKYVRSSKNHGCVSSGGDC